MSVSTALVNVQSSRRLARDQFFATYGVATANPSMSRVNESTNKRSGSENSSTKKKRLIRRKSR